jgi:hypothetical protein
MWPYATTCYTRACVHIFLHARHPAVALPISTLLCYALAHVCGFAAGLLATLAACPALAAALELLLQQQQQGNLQQQESQQQGQQSSWRDLLYIAYMCMFSWIEFATGEWRSRVSSQGHSRDLLGDADNAALAPAIARLALVLLRTPVSVRSSSSSSSSSSSRDDCVFDDDGFHLVVPLLTRLQEYHIVTLACNLLTAAAGDAVHSMPLSAVLQLLGHPEMMMLVLLRLALSASAVHGELRQARLPTAAAAATVALRRCAGQQPQQQQQQECALDPWYEQLLLSLGVPAAELPTVTAAAIKQAGNCRGHLYCQHMLSAVLRRLCEARMNATQAAAAAATAAAAAAAGALTGPRFRSCCLRSCAFLWRSLCWSWRCC